jgi:hypothetical protein
MPASEIMAKFKAHKLHSGKGGKIVTNPHQARAIQLSYLRKEGHDIPMKGMASHLNKMKASGKLKSAKKK